MDLKEFLRPTPLKLIVTVLLPAVIAYIVTLQTESILNFYWYLLTPIIKVWADEMFNEFNP
ncbi:MAG: hypothetical protein NWE89_09110 [Candidatus Bathyarchaeota archaeon]|nr:hypothetical protein [Candidatus Bathyarchaeota archaeon]